MSSSQSGTGFTVFRVPGGPPLRPNSQRPGSSSNLRTESLPPASSTSSVSSSGTPVNSQKPEPSVRSFTPFSGPVTGTGMLGAPLPTVSMNMNMNMETAAITVSSGNNNERSARESALHASQTSDSDSVSGGVNTATATATSTANRSEYDDSSLNWMKNGRVLKIKETGESFRFPLTPDNVPHANITPEIANHLRATLEESIQRAIKMGAVTWQENPCMSPLNAKHQWKIHQQKKDSSMYRRKADGMLQRNFLMRSKYECSLDELMMSVLNTSTEDERTFLAHAYREEFLDGCVVAVLEEPSVEDPYHLFAVKWCAFQTPMDSMFAARDMMYAEFSRTVVDKGQRYVARIIQSIKDCNISERRLHFVRNEMWSVQLFRALPGSNDKRVDMTMSGTISFPSESSTPTYVGNRFLTSIFNMSSSQAFAADAKYICNNNLVSQKTWVPNNERSCCNVCFKSFGFLRSRHHCRICAEIMCTNCMMELSLRTSKLPPMQRPEGCLVSPEKFCYNCVVKGREKRGSMMLQIMQRSGADTDLMDEEDRNSESQVESSCSENSPPAVVQNMGGWSAKVIHQKQEMPQRYGGGMESPMQDTRTRTATASRDNRQNGENGGFQPHSLPSELGAMDENGYYQDPNYRPQPGYGAPPPQGYKGMPQGYGGPPAIGYGNQPPMGYGAPQGYAPPPQTGYGPPQPGYGPPQPGYGPPRGGYALPPAGYAQPPQAAYAPAPLPQGGAGMPGVPGPAFAQVEESIAAQQALLRSMMMEGQKIMAQTRGGGVQPPPQVNAQVIVESSDSDMIKLVPPPETSIEALD